MTLPLRVLGNRVLVRPDREANAPAKTDGGIYMAMSLAAAVTGEDQTTNFSRGTVVAVGNPKHPLHVEASTMATKLEAYDYDELHYGYGGLCLDAAAMLRDVVRRQPCVAVDDDVLFPLDAGQQITIALDTYVILTEDELLAVVTD